MADVDEDVLYTMLHRVVEKRKTYPTLIMNKEKDRFAAELQKLEQMKVELDDNEELKSARIAANDAMKMMSRLEVPKDLQKIEQELRRKQAIQDELTLFMNLRSNWNA